MVPAIYSQKPMKHQQFCWNQWNIQRIWKKNRSNPITVYLNFLYIFVQDANFGFYLNQEYLFFTTHVFPFNSVHDTQSPVFCVMLCRSLFFILFFDLHFLIIRLISSSFFLDISEYLLQKIEKFTHSLTSFLSVRVCI